MKRLHVNQEIVPHLAAIAAAALFSTGGAAIKACRLTDWQVAGFRSGVAALTLLLFLPRSRRLSLRAFVIGATYAATLVLFVRANKLTTAAHTIFLQSTAPLYVILLGHFLLRERVRVRDLPFVLGMLGGIALLLGDSPPLVTAPRPVQGNLLALASGLAWALTLIGLRWSESRAGGAASVVVAGNLLAFFFSLPRALPLVEAASSDWLLIGYLGTVQIALAYVLLTYALRHVTALEVSLLVLLEPVLNPLWVWLVQGERLGLWSLSGCALVLVATTGRTLLTARVSARQASRRWED